MSVNSMRTVTILLSTYNGSQYIEEQLNSLISQSNVVANILVRDDGSTDQTKDILNKWQKAGLITWYEGENLKSALSFMHLIFNAPKSEYYAFCDQDDIWDEDKLNEAITQLEKHSKETPNLYFSNTRMVDKKLNIIHKLNKVPNLSIGSALLVNPAIGCTMVFNYKLMTYLREFENNNLHMHDAWVYRVCSALKGTIIFDEVPHISYRQHGENVVGGNESPFKKYRRRISDVLISKKRIREKDSRNLIKGYSHIMDQDILTKVKKVAYYRESIFMKIRLLKDTSIRTGDLEHDISYFISVIFNSL